jgi:protein-tyrosine phosphatase
VLEDTAEVLADLRAEGRTVLLHCVQAYSRTPTMGALHAMRSSGLSSRAAIDLMEDALPGCNPNPAFRAALRRLDRAGDVETGREHP